MRTLVDRAARVRNLLSRICYRGAVPNWRVLELEELTAGVLIQYGREETDCKTGQRMQTLGRKWYVSQWATDSEIVQTALLAILTFEEHEAREHFLFNGRRVYGPHISIAALAQVADEEEVRP